MSDDSGSVGGVGGVGGSSGAGASSAADAASQANAVDAVAESMVDNATTAVGVDTAALAGQLAAVESMVDPAAAQALQASIEAQLSPVEVGQFQASLDAARAAQPATSLVDQINASPLAGMTFAGSLIDACGNPVATLSAPSQLAPGKMSFDQVMDHIGKITGGPISGVMYNGAYLGGASQKTLDAVYGVGKALDGFVEPLSDRATSNPVW
ncbi:hypothetical protein [Sphingomonas crocodyli]|uniref:Uncharacterized protein n=1 Tax=Sphingomonas crocodyli TaxID=1979270 RepID=A0A437MBB9_9SPHN|nr:hypothetical protein [Sphingomonas crocodyli]RVT94928.1 hypothetical protein EOD43_14310 [Sphingomonas crocodyli]